MAYHFKLQTLWSREMHRMMTHAMYRAHTGSEQDVDLLRSLNDYYDLQSPRVAYGTMSPSVSPSIDARSPTPSPILRSASPEPPPVSSVHPQQVQFVPTQTPDILRDILDRPQTPNWLPDVATASAFLLICDERTVIGSNGANARIEAVYLICAAEPVHDVMRRSGFSYQCLRSMCQTLKRVGAQAYLHHLIMRY